LTETEQKMLGKAKASAVALPIAAAKQGYAPTPVTDCVKNGMNVALGTDSAVASGNLDLFEVMRMVALQARQAGGDSDVMPAVAPLMMATVCGARAQGRADECGMLKEGMDADIVLVDFSAPHLMPCHNVVSSLVFSAKGGDVAMTMVRGKILYQNGQFPTLDLKAIVSEMMEYAIPKMMEKEEV
jgi:5-methylthioadenosine/S-adenosylhomocysteine deaminase